MKLAEAQHGLITRSQACALGMSDDDIGYQLRSHRWLVVDQGVYRVAGAPVTWEQRLHGLVLACGPVAAASHRSAAALLTIPGFDRCGAVEVTTPRPRRHRGTEEIVHRWRPFPDHHLTVIEGISTTRVARTLFDLAGVLHPRRVERAVDNCLAAGTTTIASLHDTVRELASRGRRGTTLMRILLADRFDGYVAPASELEARFLELVRAAGLPEPARQLDAGDSVGWIGRIDFAYPSHRLLIELDSHRHHSSKLDRESDEDRDARLLAAGWRVERFTWDDLVQRPQRVVARLEALLAASAA